MARDLLDEALQAVLERDLAQLPRRVHRCDPDALWERASEHGLDLALALAVRAAWDVDARFLVRAADTVRLARARTQEQLRQLIAADQALAAAGIPVLWLRGPALAVAAYGDVFARRPGRDLDALVRPGDLHRAQAIAPGIDVAATAPGLSDGFDAWGARARTVDVGVPVRTLSDGDHLRVLAARAGGRRRVRYGDALDRAMLQRASRDKG